MARRGTPPEDHHCRRPGQAGRAGTDRSSPASDFSALPVPVPVQQETLSLIFANPQPSGWKGAQPQIAAWWRWPTTKSGASNRPSPTRGSELIVALAAGPRRPVGGHSHAHPGRPRPARPRRITIAGQLPSGSVTSPHQALPGLASTTAAPPGRTLPFATSLSRTGPPRDHPVSRAMSTSTSSPMASASSASAATGSCTTH